MNCKCLNALFFLGILMIENCILRVQKYFSTSSIEEIFLIYIHSERHPSIIDSQIQGGTLKWTESVTANGIQSGIAETVFHPARQIYKRKSIFLSWIILKIRGIYYLISKLTWLFEIFLAVYNYLFKSLRGNYIIYYSVKDRLSAGQIGHSGVIS